MALPCSQNDSLDLKEIVDEFVDDDEAEMIAALEIWAKVLPKRKRNKARREADIIAAVDQKRDLVKKELEELDEDEELVLTDAGCDNHACDPNKHVLGFRMRPSK